VIDNINYSEPKFLQVLDNQLNTLTHAYCCFVFLFMTVKTVFMPICLTTW